MLAMLYARAGMGVRTWSWPPSFRKITLVSFVNKQQNVYPLWKLRTPLRVSDGFPRIRILLFFILGRLRTFGSNVNCLFPAKKRTRSLRPIILRRNRGPEIQLQKVSGKKRFIRASIEAVFQKFWCWCQHTGWRWLLARLSALMRWGRFGFLLLGDALAPIISELGQFSDIS